MEHKYLVVDPIIAPRSKEEPLRTAAPANRPEWRALREIGADLLRARCRDEEELIQATRDADAIIAGHVPLNRRVIENMEKCVIIVRRGVGYEQIDIPAATEHNILVAYIPDSCIEEVANHTIMFLLACARKLTIQHNGLRSGKWFSPEDIAPLPTIYNQTIGLVGYGTMARAVARKAKAFHMHVVAYDPFVNMMVAWEDGVYLYRSNLDRLLKESDYVSLHTPLSEATYHLLGERELKLMKPTAYLINTARGPVVDEEALIKALQEGWIAGAGLDVFEKEPIDINNPLLRMDNVIVTSHLGGETDESVFMLRDRTGAEVARVLKGLWPLNPLNPVVNPRVELKRGGGR